MCDDGEEKKLFALRKEDIKRDQKWSNFAHKSKKKAKKKKKRADHFSLHSSAQETLYKERARESTSVREKKKDEREHHQ